MEKVHKTGKTMLSMKEIGEMEWQRGKVLSIMQMEIFTLENFTRIEQMALENMSIKMVKNMLVSGKTICKMVLVKKN